MPILAGSTARSLRVLVAHLESEAGGNPDLKQIYDQAGPFSAAVVRHLTGRRLMAQRWDIIHIYWPEWCIRRDRGEFVLALDAIRFLGQLCWVRRRGAGIVWSANNLRPHEPGRFGIVTLYIAAFVRLVDHLHGTSDHALEALYAAYPTLREIPATIAPLGHYRDHYPNIGISQERARDELGLPLDATIALSIGMVRPYKNTVALIGTHRRLAASNPRIFLVIAGHCPDAELAEDIRRECLACPTARADLEYVADADIERYVRAADFVVVAGRSVLNSGSAMLALSFDRPVLVPHTGSLIALNETYGPYWTMTFDGDLQVATLQAAHQRWARTGSTAAPILPAWPDVACALLSAFTAMTAADAPAGSVPCDERSRSR